ncbi:hypothetical protein GCM10028787_31590 [Brachybacterium horti]
MNKYGQMLRRQWEIASPQLVESLSDPTEHFSTMGAQVEAEVLELLPTMEGTDPAGETYLQKVARLQAARATAEETVLAQYQPPSDSPEPDEPEDWDEMSHDDQETWIRANVPAGEHQQEMLTDLEARRTSRMIGLGAGNDPAAWED